MLACQRADGVHRPCGVTFVHDFLERLTDEGLKKPWHADLLRSAARRKVHRAGLICDADLREFDAPLPALDATCDVR